MTTPTTEQKKTALAEVVRIAGTQVGVHEVPHYSNEGPQVEAYLAAVGLGGGYSWCMAFVVWTFKQAGYMKFLKATGSCQDQADFAKSEGLLVSAQDAKGRMAPGWIMLQWHPELNRYAHTGIVTSYDVVTGDFWTIEGNSTNDPAQRNGDGVVKQHRNIGDVRGGHARYAFIQTS